MKELSKQEKITMPTGKEKNMPRKRKVRKKCNLKKIKERKSGNGEVRIQEKNEGCKDGKEDK